MAAGPPPDGRASLSSMRFTAPYWLVLLASVAAYQALVPASAHVVAEALAVHRTAQTARMAVDPARAEAA